MSEAVSTLLDARLLARTESASSWAVRARRDHFTTNSHHAVDSYFLVLLAGFLPGRVTRRVVFDLPEGVQVEKSDDGLRVTGGTSRRPRAR